MITIIAAIGRDGAIGKGGALPWSIPEDMRHFRGLTMGHAVVMGRRTWESIPERYRPLPGRTNIVLSRDREAHMAALDQGAHAVEQSLAGAIHEASALGLHLDIIGGAQVYREAMPLADALELTEVDVEVEGADTWFPLRGLGSAVRRRDGSLVADTLAITGGLDGSSPSMLWREVSRRRGADPRLTFARWERVR